MVYSISIYAVITTSGLTSLILIFIPLIFIFKLKLKFQRENYKKPSKALFILLIYFTANFLLKYLQLYHLQQGKIFIFHFDQIFYSILAHMLNETKIETIYFSALLDFNDKIGLVPYHYLDIWFTSSLIHYLPLNSPSTLIFTVYPLFGSITCLFIHSLIPTKYSIPSLVKILIVLSIILLPQIASISLDHIPFINSHLALYTSNPFISQSRYKILICLPFFFYIIKYYSVHKYSNNLLILMISLLCSYLTVGLVLITVFITLRMVTNFFYSVKHKILNTIAYQIEPTQGKKDYVFDGKPNNLLLKYLNISKNNNYLEIKLFVFLLLYTLFYLFLGDKQFANSNFLRDTFLGIENLRTKINVISGSIIAISYIGIFFIILNFTLKKILNLTESPFSKAQIIVLGFLGILGSIFWSIFCINIDSVQFADNIIICCAFYIYILLLLEVIQNRTLTILLILVAIIFTSISEFNKLPIPIKSSSKFKISNIGFVEVDSNEFKSDPFMSSTFISKELVSNYFANDGYYTCSPGTLFFEYDKSKLKATHQVQRQRQDLLFNYYKLSNNKSKKVSDIVIEFMKKFGVNHIFIGRGKNIPFYLTPYISNVEVLSNGHGKIVFLKYDKKI